MGCTEIGPLSCWDSIGAKHQELFVCGPGLWVFRGQRRADWSLQSTLDRAAARWCWTTKTKFSKQELEDGLLRKFERHAHLYEAQIPVPARGRQLEWLALMQHYGAPTRLLDWTYSFWNALFFAVEGAGPEDEPCVWAIESHSLKKTALALLRNENREVAARAHEQDPHAHNPMTFRRLYRDSDFRFVLKQNTWRLNQRLVAQQGVFLCPGSVKSSFQENLDAMSDGVRMNKLLIDPTLVPEIIASLHRMNITRATLFPGFQGFVESLENLMATPEIVCPSGVIGT